MHIVKEPMVLNFARRKITMEFDNQGRVHCKLDNLPPMQVSICHFTANGGLLVLFEPVSPPPLPPLPEMVS